jgi:hypothetical protein
MWWIGKSRSESPKRKMEREEEEGEEGVEVGGGEENHE